MNPEALFSSAETLSYNSLGMFNLEVSLCSLTNGQESQDIIRLHVADFNSLRSLCGDCTRAVGPLDLDEG